MKIRKDILDPFDQNQSKSDELSVLQILKNWIFIKKTFIVFRKTTFWSQQKQLKELSLFIEFRHRKQKLTVFLKNNENIQRNFCRLSLLKLSWTHWSKFNDLSNLI